MSVALAVTALNVVFARDRVPDGNAQPASRASDRASAGLRELSFAVTAGDCLAVLGASGSGKSSLLRALAGLQRSNGGRIAVNGRDVTRTRVERRGIVYLHQEPVLFPNRSVVDNVAFPLEIRGISKHDARDRALRWLERLQVHELADRAPDALSGGQRHRVALARALCAEPSVLLLDEPLASLDPAVRRDVRAALLAARAASGAAMVLVTHDLDDALAVATQMSAISGGRLTAPELPATMLQAPPSLDVARLLGVYAEVHGTVSGDASGLFHWIGGAVPASGVAAGAMIACVRSHEVTVRAACDAASPELIVTARRDGALDSTLTVATPAGEQAVVRVGSGVVCAVGDAVQLTITASRFFFPD